MKITIQGALPTFNEMINVERRNRFMAAKMKKTETTRIQWACKGITPIQGKVDITLQAFVKNKRKDPDGIYCYALKLILDSLVGLGILQNDTQEFIGRIIFEPIEIDKEERMEIVIEQAL